MNSGSQKPGGRIKQSLRLGASGKPRLAVTTRPAKGTPLKEGGKVNGGKRKHSIGAAGLLGKWLHPLGKDSRGPRGKATEEVEDKSSLDLQGGQRERNKERQGE